MKEEVQKEIRTFTNLNKALRSRTAFIYKKTNCSSFEAIPVNNLFGLICDIGDVFSNKSYIPDELINQVDLSVEAPEVIYDNSNYNIVYFSPFASDTIENVLNIVKLFNNLPSLNINIYTSLAPNKFGVIF